MLYLKARVLNLFTGMVFNMIFDYLSRELVFAGSGWFAAQLCKCVVNLITKRDFDLKYALFGSGGMPSSHSATVCALATTVAVDEGLNSPLFGVAFILAFIVCYDAMNVRLETGRQGKVINDMTDIFREMGKTLDVERAFKELVGHTPLQVLVGCVIGILVGLSSSVIR